MFQSLPASLLLLAASFLPAVDAQQAAFIWGFNNNIGTNLPRCSSQPLFIDDTKGTVKPVPPYYLIAYPLTSPTNDAVRLPSVFPVGTTRRNASWNVGWFDDRQQVLMTLVDSVGNSGGVLSNPFTVATTAASAKDCHPPNPKPSSPLKLKANITANKNTLNTCDSIRISLTGGKKPYTVTVAETNTAAGFNFTMGGKDDTFIWVNNLSPSGRVTFTASDANNRYAESSQLLNLTGSSNTRCPTKSRSLVGGSGDGGGNGGGNGDGSGNADNKSSGSKGAIVGGVLAGLVFLGLCITFVFFLYRRRRLEQQNRFSTSSPGSDAGNGGGGGFGAWARFGSGHKKEKSAWETTGGAGDTKRPRINLDASSSEVNLHSPRFDDPNATAVTPYEIPAPPLPPKNQAFGYASPPPTSPQYSTHDMSMTAAALGNANANHLRPPAAYGRNSETVTDSMIVGSYDYNRNSRNSTYSTELAYDAYDGVEDTSGYGHGYGQGQGGGHTRGPSDASSGYYANSSYGYPSAQVHSGAQTPTSAVPLMANHLPSGTPPRDPFSDSQGGWQYPPRPVPNSVPSTPPSIRSNQTGGGTQWGGFRAANPDGPAAVYGRDRKSVSGPSSALSGRQPYQHQDAGAIQMVVEEADGGDLDEVPPVYPGPKPGFSGMNEKGGRGRS